MKHVIVCLILITAMVAPYHGYAATEGAYLTVGVGTFKVNKINPSNVERNFLNSPNVTASYTKEDDSMNNEIGIGYCINEYFCTDVVYVRGVKIKTSTKITSINSSPINIAGATYGYPGGSYIVYPITVSPGNYATNIRFDRNGEASAVRFAVSGEYPLTERIGVLGRVGVYHWRAHVEDKVCVDNSGICLTYNEYDKGTAPMASVGAIFKFTDKTDVGMNYLRIRDISITSLNLRYRL